LLWFITIPFWKLFFEKVLNVSDSDAIFELVLVLIPFYVLYVYNTLADSVFYGKGKTELLALQSIITNVTVHGTAFILFRMGIFDPTLMGIALLFGTGIFVDSIVTYVLYFRYLRQVDYRL
jgi:O-antigen/teichoic acid export membrane protein